MWPELNGIVIVDKPAGISSAGVVARVKKIFNARKLGHTGTLDPFATGVLICCINRATRLSRFLLEGDKAYEAELVLGISTDTQDATGTVVQKQSPSGISSERIREVAEDFVGSITQVPPVYSALKHRGTPLYKLARLGKAVEKPARTVRIDRLIIQDVCLPVVRFVVHCSSGTYIRTLCADMGRTLGCGGHLKELRRTASCGFTIDDAIDLEHLERLRDQKRLAEAVVSMNEALPRMPAALVDDQLARKIKNGMKLTQADLPRHPLTRHHDVFKVVDQKGQLLAVLTSTPTGTYNYCCVL